MAALRDSPVVFLGGARQTGKSTLVQWVVAEEHKARYLTLDDLGVLSAARDDPQGFLAGLDGRVALDEVQRAPELFRAIKLAVDRDQRAAPATAGRGARRADNHPGERLTKTPKLFLTDTGLLAHLLGLGQERLENQPSRLGPAGRQTQQWRAASWFSSLAPGQTVCPPHLVEQRGQDLSHTKGGWSDPWGCSRRAA